MNIGTTMYQIISAHYILIVSLFFAIVLIGYSIKQFFAAKHQSATDPSLSVKHKILHTALLFIGIGSIFLSTQYPFARLEIIIERPIDTYLEPVVAPYVLSGMDFFLARLTNRFLLLGWLLLVPIVIIIRRNNRHIGKKNILQGLISYINQRKWIVLIMGLIITLSFFATTVPFIANIHSLVYIIAANIISRPLIMIFFLLYVMAYSATFFFVRYVLPQQILYTVKNYNIKKYSVVALITTILYGLSFIIPTLRLIPFIGITTAFSELIQREIGHTLLGLGIVACTIAIHLRYCIRSGSHSVNTNE